MADADFTVKAIVSAQTSQFEKGMKNAQSSINNVSKSIEGVQKLLKSAFSIVGIGVSIKAVTDFGKSCVQSANQAIKTFNILDNTVKATGATAWTSTQELEKMSKELSDSTNYSVTEIQNMQSVLLGFTNITGEAFDGASEAVLDMATVMGMDLTSAVQTIGKALDDPVSGLDSLRRQGFKFTDEQKAELGQLVKNGKQLEAQKIILDTLAISYGGASKAGQDSFAKQRHALENFRDTLGSKLIPVMQVFAENSANTFNKLTDVVSKIDFTPIVNVLSNLNEKFKSVFETIKNYLINAGNQVKDFTARFNFKPVISLLDTLIGVVTGVIAKFREMNSQKLDFFDKIKESLISISNTETFQNIVDFINKFIDGAFFIWETVQDITMEIRQLIFDKAIEIWNKIKEVFQNGQEALAGSGQDIASWGDFFYNVLNNVFKIFQDFFNMIKAIIHGDWSVAWEYAKLTVMRLADNILDIFSNIANAFPDLINGILKGWNKIIENINKARTFFGQDPLDLAEMFEPVDLSKKTGLEDKIEEVENKIKELTGKAADQSIQDLKGVSEKFSGFTFSMLGSIGDLSEGTKKELEKQKYVFQQTSSSAETAYQKFSEWDSKLLQQRLEDLEEWSDEAHKINLQLIEEERKKALEADETGAEVEKINKYYNKQIEKEDKRASKAKQTHWKETVKSIFNTVKKFASNVIKVFQNIISKLSSTFSSVKDFFVNLFDFSIDDSLDSFLEGEDKILTFFTETIKKLPDYLSSVLESISVLLDNILSSNFDDISNILVSLFNTLAEKLPDIMSKFITIAGKLITSIFDVFSKINIEPILNSLNEIFIQILTFITQNLDKIIDGIFSALIAGIKYITSNISTILPLLLSGLTTLITELLNHLPELLDVLLTAIEQILSAIISNLPDILRTLIPALLNAILDAIKVLLKHLPDIIAMLAESIPEIIMGILDGLIDFVKDLQVSDLMGLVMAIVKAIGELAVGLIQNIPQIIAKLATFIGELFLELLKAIPQILADFFKGIWETLKSIVKGIGDFFKKLFTGQLFSSSSSSSSSDSSSSSSSSSIWDALGSSIKGYAIGSSNVPRGLALVGEAGPELVNFKGGEQVINNSNTQKALAGASGTNITQNVTFTNMKDTTAFAMIQQLRQYNRQMAINGII